MIQLLMGKQSSLLDKSKLAKKPYSVHIVMPRTHFFALIGPRYFNNNTDPEIQVRKQ